ncbi:MAG: hypothetical protein AB1758_11645 [Candidatus Eremiobacterota bacterium]
MNPINAQLQRFATYVREHASGSSHESVHSSERMYAAHGLDRLEHTPGDTLEQRVENYADFAEKQSSVGFWTQWLVGPGALLAGTALLPAVAPILPIVGLVLTVAAIPVGMAIQARGEYNREAAQVLDKFLPEFRKEEPAEVPRTLLAS